MSHEHGGGEEAIKRSNLEAQQYNDAKRSHNLGEIALNHLEEQEEVLAPGITYDQTDREYKRLLTYSEDILNLRLGVIDAKLKDNNNKTLSLEADRNRLLNERLLVLNVLNEKFWAGK